MKIKSLLIGSAALMTASSGAYAADAIVMADPEPVEYVRVCDVYGAGFFYIPGTETCMQISGYVRYEVRAHNWAVTTWPSADARVAAGWGIAGAAATAVAAPNTIFSHARFAPTFDIRTENEYGTLRAYARVLFNYQTGSFIANTGNLHYVRGAQQSFNVEHAFIEQTLGGGTVRLGKTQRPYARFLGFGASGLTHDGDYGYAEASEVSYTFSGGNGFTAIAAVMADGNVGNWMPDVEAGFNFAQGWGSIGAIAGYDSSTNTWGAKAVARFTGGNGFSGGLHVFYTSGAGQYQVSAFQTNWSVLANASFAFSPKASLAARAQWYDNGNLSFGAGLGFTPVSGLLIRPEVSYTTGVNSWAGVVRVERSF